MAGGHFTADVTDWVRKTEARMLDVFQTAAQYVIEEIVDRTRRDTGYLVSSFTVTLDGPLPIRADARPPEGTGKNAYDVEPYGLTLAGAQLGSTIYGSFVASYALVREYHDGMVRLSVQNWQAHVDRAVSAAKARVQG